MNYSVYIFPQKNKQNLILGTQTILVLRINSSLFFGVFIRFVLVKKVSEIGNHTARDIVTNNLWKQQFVFKSWYKFCVYIVCATFLNLSLEETRSKSSDCSQRRLIITFAYWLSDANFPVFKLSVSAENTAETQTHNPHMQQHKETGWVHVQMS